MVEEMLKEVLVSLERCLMVVAEEWNLRKKMKMAVAACGEELASRSVEFEAMESVFE